MKKYTLLVALSLVLISCGSDKKETSTNKAPAIAVTVSSVNSENNNSFFTASGKIKAANQVILSTRTSGFVDNIYY